MMSKKAGKEKLGFLIKYKWSSFAGFIIRKKMDELINYGPV